MLQFGSFITLAAADPRGVVALAVASETAGLDLVSFQDHPYQPASLDLLSAGRFALAFGTGAFWDAIVAMGGERRTPGAAVRAVEEAIGVIRDLWDTSIRDRVQRDCEIYQVVGAKRGPAPAHPIPIWLGAYRPRMLRMIGTLADGCRARPCRDKAPVEYLAGRCPPRLARRARARPRHRHVHRVERRCLRTAAIRRADGAGRTATRGRRKGHPAPRRWVALPRRGGGEYSRPHDHRRPC